MKRKMILLVEDDSGDEALIMRSLKKHNILNSVIVARDGAQALDYLFQREGFIDDEAWELPQLVILDLNLPKIGGLDVLAQIRANEKTRLCPVVILTSSNEERDRLSGYLNGANSYVTKPIEFEDFSNAIRQLGVYWLLLNEVPATS